VRRAIGLAFQTPLTSKHLTAREVLVHHARLYNVAKAGARDRADELLAFVELSDRADDRVTTFSGGMKRRLDLARALMTEPDVLVLDEPASGLDPRAKRSVRERVETLVDEGTTVLLATHEMDQAQALADRVAILDRGRLAASGTPSELTEELGHRVVAVDAPQGGALDEIATIARDLGVADLRRDADTIELELADGSATPGEIVDALDEQAIAYEEVRVREPDLADVFLEATGHRLDEEGSK
jgi:ABC-2 type transport system ATP-binding protein